MTGTDIYVNYGYFLVLFLMLMLFSEENSSGMSSLKSKAEKEKERLTQEKVQAILTSMLRDEDNKYCVDCDSKGPRWASWNLGVFLCIRCAGIHRNLGVHISKVKSVNLDSWTPQQVAVSVLCCVVIIFYMCCRACK